MITGTHGKTTTSSLTAFLLAEAGVEPGWLIGGVPRDLPGGSKLGNGKPFVLEGDEYDTAFFDKRSKFIHYRPRIAVLNNLEFDHADIFRDLQDVQRSFQHFLRIIPSEGFAIFNGDDPNIQALLPTPWTQMISVGIGEKNDLIIANFKDSAEAASFDLIWKGTLWTTVKWPLHGLYNARNAAMAGIAAAFASGCGSPVEFDLSTLAKFRGVCRRQDVLHTSANCTVLEDFGHHPTAIAVTLEGVRAAYPDREIIAIFEPRSNTARTKLFQDTFTEALAVADRAFIGAVHRADSVTKDKRLNTKAMATELSERGCRATAFDNNEDLFGQIQEESESVNDVVFVFFTNGSFDAVQHRTAELFDKKNLQ